MQNAQQLSVPLIPREVLFGNPVKTDPRISPDGKRIAYLAPVDNVLNVWVRTVGREDDHPVTHDRDRGVRIYFWAEDNRHIVYLQDRGGDENWRIYAVDLTNGAEKELTPFESVQAQIIDTSKRLPHLLLVALNKENLELHDAYRLDLGSGQLEMAAKNPGDVMEWIADADLQVRGAVAGLPDGGSELRVRLSEADEWQTVLQWDPEDSMTSAPLGFTLDGSALYLRDSRRANASRLVKLHLDTGQIEVLAEDPQYDVTEVIVHPDTYEPQAVAFLKARQEWVVLDEDIRHDIEQLHTVHRGDLRFNNRDHSDTVWLVGYVADDGPVSFYAYDRNTKTATFLFDNRPELRKYTLAPMQPFSFTARDGLTIHGYITFPPGLERKGLPMVLNVHGGPWWRDVWGFDPQAQWLANRGYICMQVNFRGSTGYGKHFVNAGDREWAGKMHDDLIDAVQWAIEQGYADPKRVAIYGGSYGGYAALVGATFTPDVFCCAVDIVGPSNLITLIRSVPPYWSTMLSIFHRRVGNPDTDEEFLISRSPLFKADRIRIPILIAQGANDPRVKQAESEQIVEAMRQRGLDYQYLLFPDEGHGFAKPENRIKFIAEAEKFLAKHLGGRYEEAKPN